ncbi:MAG: hypothetical protein FWC79_07995 [Oscillospiraceae bacterium]|nr:hypothetical protein [Oscillospiraceae bacterium]
MNIYISHSSSYDYTNKLYNPIKESDLKDTNNFYFPHDDGTVVNTRSVISEFDLVIAEVSRPTTGQGIELGWASYVGTPILCIYEKGARYSSALPIVAQDFMEYENAQDMISKIRDYLEKGETK